MTDTVMGLPWYTPEAWAELVAMPEARIDKSYQDYIRSIEDIERRMAAEGVPTKRATIDIAHMAGWCHRHGYEVDSKGRTTYVAMLTLADGDRAALDAMPIVDKTRSVQ